MRGKVGKSHMQGDEARRAWLVDCEELFPS